MPNLNVQITEEAIRAAKAASAKEGMLLRKWVERVILEAAAREGQTKPPKAENE